MPPLFNLRSALPRLLPLAVPLLLAACVVPVPLGRPVDTRPVADAAGFSPRCAPTPGTATAEAQVLALVNDQRRRVGVPALRASAVLARAAQDHACDNAARDSHGHVSSDGAKLGERLRRAGYRLQTAAENTGRGFDTPDRLVAFWMASPGHSANLLNPVVREAGLGRAIGPGPHWVLVMAAPR